nr:phospholipase D-like domain-containing protein [Maribacter stanieri]
MKFCVIDYNTVISGSANWSKKAFSTNNEEVTIVIDNLQRANEFVTEFQRLKTLSSKIDDNNIALTLNEIYKYFKLIKAFLDIGEPHKMQPYLYKLEDHIDLKEIVPLLKTADYDSAVIRMIAFEKENSILVDVFSIEKEQLLNQINLISFQLESLEAKKADVERLLEQFNHRYILELNPLISKILQLKRKIYKKLERFGFVDENFKKVDEEFH